MLPTEPLVRERLATLHDEIARHGRLDVTVVAVTKGQPPELIPIAVAAGCAAIGENYAQELVAKRPALDALEGHRPELHFIGRLQTNKVRLLAGIVDVWESVDRPAAVDAIASRAPAARILVQVNATGERRKGGCSPPDTASLVEYATAHGLHVDGLMTVGPTTAGADPARSAFRTVRALADQIGVATCSMGMSGDYRVALEEGATELRIGSLLFGPRPQANARTR